MLNFSATGTDEGAETRSKPSSYSEKIRGDQRLKNEIHIAQSLNMTGTQELQALLVEYRSRICLPLRQFA